MRKLGCHDTDDSLKYLRGVPFNTLSGIVTNEGTNFVSPRGKA